MDGTTIDLGTYRLHLDDARLAYGELRSRYFERGRAHRRDFLNIADIARASAPIEIIQQSLKLAVEDAVELSLEQLASFNIYDVSEDALRQEIMHCAQRHEALSESEHVQGLAQGMEQHAAERHIRSLEAFECRPQLIGGGFGVQGALGGMLIAGTANAATGAVYKLSTKIRDAAASAADKRRLREVLARPDMRDRLGEDLLSTVVAGAPVVAKLINNQMGKLLFGLVDEEQIARARTMCQNILKGRVPEADVEQVLGEAISLDPFSAELWELRIDRFGDHDGAIDRAANLLCLPFLEDFKTSMVRSVRGSLGWSTPEECADSSKALESLTLRLGLSFEDERRSIQQRIMELDNARKTVDGVLHGTSEEAEAARARKADKESRTYNGDLYDTPELAEAARTCAQDRADRTFGGTVYSTAQEALLARKRYLQTVSPLLWLTIILGPIPNALFTMQRGFTTSQRLIAFGALVFWTLPVIISDFPVLTAIVCTLWGLLLLLARAFIGATVEQLSKLLGTSKEAAR